jgi:hypothetical protein
MDKQCKQCQKQFNVSDHDLTFLDKISPTFAGQKFDIPAPTLCPHCRWQRRIAWRNEYALYKRKCDLTGKEMISKHHATSAFPVYYMKEWQGDTWNALDYAQDFDPSKSFFEQIGELINKVPRQSVLNDHMNDINSEFTNCAGSSKNCYMIFESDRNEECYYSRGMTDNKDCVDCLHINESQICYEAVDAFKCYNCFFVRDLENCNECYFSSNLIGCKYCFGCDGLSQKEYYLYNENVGKDKWDEFMRSVKFTPENIKTYTEKWEQVRQSRPKRFAKISKCENSHGDHLNNCKNANFCFDSQKLEDCAYCFEVQNDAKDAYDFSTFGLATAMLYECNSSGYGANTLLFSNDTWNNAQNCYYCDNVQSSKNCFGCVGLRKGEYCILNKQYTPEEYDKKVAEIIAHMQKTNEWGEYFPMSISVFGYNETLANDYFPLNKDQAAQMGAKWQDDDRMIHFDGPFYEPKPDIAEYQNNEQERQALLNGILKCDKTSKPYKIIPQELLFYVKHKLPIPTTSFEARHKARIALRNPMNLWERACDCEQTDHDHSGKCPNKFESSYSPERPYKIYCEKCYQESIG